jgi:3-oxoacyl-[acyl-carrier protein] reductase
LRNKIFEGKKCIITGATGGLGKQIAIEFAQAGCNLFLTGRNNEKLELLKKELKMKNQEIEIFYRSADLTKNEDIIELIEIVREKFSTIDILINCAGNFPVNPLSESTMEEFDSCMNLNVRAPFVLSKEFSKDMIKNKWGRIVNIASSSAHNGFKNAAIYCASKHALLGLSRTLFAELKNQNVRTFCISPGSMKTRMAKEDEGLLAEQDYNTFMEPNEVAEFIIKIISYDNEMVSQEINLSRLIIN